MFSEMIARHPWLWTLAWQSTLCLAAGLAGSYLLKRRAVRAHQILLLALIAAAILPIASQVIRQNQWGLLTAKPPASIPAAPALSLSTVDIIAPVSQTIDRSPSTPQTMSRPSSAPHVEPAPQVRRFEWSKAVAAVWLTAGSILLLRLLIQFLLGWRLVKRSEAMNEPEIRDLLDAARSRLGIRTAIEIRASRNTRSPVIWCWARRPILLASPDSWRDDQLDWTGILCHELAHWRRRDHLSGLWAELMVCALPWQPLAWWARKRLVTLSEEACDDWVLAAGRKATDYAKTLLELSPQNQAGLLPGVVADGKGLAGRIRRILQNRYINPRSGLRWTLAAALLTACLGLGIAFAQTSVRDPQTPDAPADKVTLTGEVRDRQGKPVPDAEILVYRTTGSGFLPWRTAELVAQGRSQADGTFTFALPDVAVDVIVRKEGLAAGGTDWWAEKEPRCEIVLDRARELIGSVVDKDGRPVVDAQVSIVEASIGEREYLSHLSWPVSAFLDVKTDENGRFVFRNLPAEGTFSVGVRKPGLAMAQSIEYQIGVYPQRQPSPDRSEIKLVMPPEASITGLVLNRDNGEPVRGIQVVAIPRDPTGSGIEESFGCVAAVSASDGSFRLGGLPPIPYTVQLAPPMEAMAEWVAEPLDMDLPEGEKVDGVRMELSRGGILEVLAKDSVTNRPLTQVDVTIEDRSRDHCPPIVGLTDSTGTARFRVLAGEYKVHGFFVAEYSCPAYDPVTVDEGETRQFALALIPDNKITGIIRDPDGNPLAGAKLGTLHPSRYGFDELRSLDPNKIEDVKLTDADGKFEITWTDTYLDPKGPGVLLVAKDDRRNLAASVRLDPQTRNLDLKLAPGVTVAGKTVKPDGTPIAKSVVLALVNESRPYSSVYMGWRATANADGAFQIRTLPALPEYKLVAYAEGYGTATVTVEGSSINDNGLDAGRIELPPANLSVSGIVVDSNDQPFAGVVVTCYPMENRSSEVTNVRTDKEGRFTIRGVCAGPLRLSVWFSRGYRSLIGDVDSEGGATDVKIVASDESAEPAEPSIPSMPSIAETPLSSYMTSSGGDPVDANSNPIADEDEILLLLTDNAGQPVARAKIGMYVIERDTYGDSVAVKNRTDWNPSLVLSDNEGRVTLEAKEYLNEWANTTVLYILHEEQGIAAVRKITRGDLNRLLPVMLKPACRVHARFDSTGLAAMAMPLRQIETFVYTKGSYVQLLFGCGSTRPTRDFESLLPPGEYTLTARGSGARTEGQAFLKAPTESKDLTITVPEGQSALDLGVIDLRPGKLADLIGHAAPEIGPMKEWKDGSAVTLPELRGRTVWLHFGESLSAMYHTSLAHLHTTYADKGLSIIAIYNSDSLADLEKTWAQENLPVKRPAEVPFRIAIDQDRSTCDKYGIPWMGTTDVLIDPAGNVMGQASLSYADRALFEMLGGKASALGDAVERKPSPTDWRKQFDAVYRLAGGEILKRIAPPLIPERLEYYRSQNGHYPNGPCQFIFRWDTRLDGWYTFTGMPTPQTLRTILEQAAELKTHEYEGPQSLLDMELPGDWIVRSKSSQETRLHALEELLVKEFQRTIRFEKRSVERAAIVATGAFKFHPLAGEKDAVSVHLYVGDADSDGITDTDTANSLPELLRAIGGNLNMPVVDRTQQQKRIQIPYQCHVSAYQAARMRNEQRRMKQLRVILDHLTEQTELRFEIRKEQVPVWFVTEQTGR